MVKIRDSKLNFGDKTTISSKTQAPKVKIVIDDGTEKDDFFSENRGVNTDFLNNDILGENSLPETPKSFLELDQSLTNYKPVAEKGFSSLRPEILSLIEFLPVYDGQNLSKLTPAGKLLDVQNASRLIQSDAIRQLLDELENEPQTKQVIDDIKKYYRDNDRLIDEELSFFYNAFREITLAKSTLNFKASSEKIKEKIATSRSRFLTVNRNDVRKLPTAKSLPEILVNDLKFDEENVKKFTNTKIFSQVLNDLSTILSSYSPKILDFVDSTRKNDTSSIKITNLDNSINNFNIRNLSSNSRDDIVNGSSRRSFDQFLSSLSQFTDVDDRMKILYIILSKELRVSTGLSLDSVNKTLLDTFNITNTDNIFQKMIGSFGSSILDNRSNDAFSIASLLNVKVDENIILPLENFRISKDLVTYIPGTEFYVESILNGVRRFNTLPFKNFADVFFSKVSTFSFITEATLDIDAINDDRLGLGTRDIFYKVNSVLAKHIEYSTKKHSSTQTSDKLTMSLLSESSSDATLKHILFLKMLLEGYHEKFSPNSTAGKNTFYDSLEESGLSASVIVDTISDLGISTFSREFPTLDSLEQTLTVGDDARVDSIKRIKQLNNDSIFEKIIVAQEILSEIIIRHVIKTQSTFIETAYPSFTLSSGASNNDGLNGFINPNDNKISDTWAKGKLSVHDNIFSDLNKILNELDLIAKSSIVKTNSENNKKGYFLENLCGASKFNSIGQHTIAMLLLEIACTTVSKFKFASLAGIKTNNLPIIEINSRIDDDKAEIARFVLHNHTGNEVLNLSLFSDSEIKNGTQFLSSQFNSIINSIESEEILVRDIVENLVVISNSIKEASDSVFNFFDNRTGKNARIINRLNEEEHADIKFAAMNFQQLLLSKFFLEDIKLVQDRLADNHFINDTIINDPVINSLKSLLREEEFLPVRGKNTRIISVGIPSGFTDKLRDKSGTFTVGQNLNIYENRGALQNDVVKINVFMQDLLNEEVVYKPKEYIFEIGRFISSNDFSEKILVENNFDDLVSNLISTRTANISTLNFDKDIGVNRDSKITNDESYNFLSNDEKNALIKNHIISYLLNVYIKLLTSIDMRENKFLLLDDDRPFIEDETVRELFNTLLVSHVSKFQPEIISIDDLREANQEFDNLLTRMSDDPLYKGVLNDVQKAFDGIEDSKNIEISQDLVTFIKTFSKDSVIYGSSNDRNLLTMPKTFERIFHVPVDPDEFEVDIDKTSITQFGGDMLKTKTFLDNFEENKVQFAKSKESGGVSLQQFFVTIDHLPQLQTLGTVNATQGTIFGENGDTNNIPDVLNDKINANSFEELEINVTSGRNRVRDATPGLESVINEIKL